MTTDTVWNLCWRANVKIVSDTRQVMKLFECQKCGQLLHFENTRCESCGSQLGYLRARETLSVVEPDGEVWRAMAEPEKRYRFCANAQYDVCNWMVDDAQPSAFCAACRH